MEKNKKQKTKQKNKQNQTKQTNKQTKKKEKIFGQVEQIVFFKITEILYSQSCWQYSLISFSKFCDLSTDNIYLLPILQQSLPTYTPHTAFEVIL